jgi:hypothetical protein
MKILAAFILLSLSITLQGQDGLQFSGKQFFAISVSNTDSASKWYEEVFGLKLLKEINMPQDGVHVRIISNSSLTVEIIQSKESKTLADCGLKQNEAFKMRGFFKTGFYVRDLTKAEAYLKDRKVVIKHGPFADKETSTKSLIIEDLNGFMIQIMEEID